MSTPADSSVGSVLGAALFACDSIGVAIYDPVGNVVTHNAAFARMGGAEHEIRVPSPDGGCVRLVFENGDRSTFSRDDGVASRMAAIGILAAGVAHEINNPLAYAMGNLSFAIEQLQSAADTSPELAIVVVALRDALEGAERVRRTVRNLRVFSRADDEAGAPVDLEHVVRSALAMAWAEVQHRARLVTELVSGVFVVAREAHLAQVFLTLLLHAAHAFEDGRADDGELALSIAADEERARVVIVARARPGASRRVGLRPAAGDDGGFGVAFCRRLVREHGGEITVLANGATAGFTVELPLSPGAATTYRAPAPTPGARGKARVLVIDDEPRIGSAIARILGPLHQVMTVYTAVDAISLIERGEKYDVVLCDIVMQEMNGIQFYERLRQIAPELTSRVVFMTGGPFSMRGSDLLETISNPRLEKPFSPDMLRTVIDPFIPAG